MPSDSQTTSAVTTPTTAEIFGVAWPMALRAIMTFSAILIDLYLVSGLGVEAVAAMGLAGAIAGLVLGMLFAFSNAAQVKIAQAYGTEKPIELKTALGCSMIINLVVVTVGILFILIFSGPITDWLAHSAQVADLAMSYLMVFVLMIFSESIGQVLASFFNGCGRTKQPFYSFLIAAPINIITSIILIHGLFGMPELGLVGAAWGTVLGSVLRLAYLLITFWGQYQHVVQTKGWLNDDLPHALRRQVVFAWPIAATFISMNFANNACTFIYTNMNIHQFAAMTLIMPWVRVAGMISYSWAQASGILIAQLLGKATPSEALEEFLSRAWRAVFVACVAVSCAYCAIVFATQWIYSDLEQETRLALFSFLPVLLVIPFPRASNAVCGNVLRASGDTHYSMRVHLFGQWACLVPVTALVVLVFNLPVAWVFAVFLLEELVKFLPFHRRIWSGRWHKIKE